MKIRLGYLGTPLTLLEHFHTITYTRYQKLNNKEETLDKIILENLNLFNNVIDYNIKNNISFYRMTHNILPLATIEDIDYDYTKFEDKWEEIGNKIKKHNLRVDAHPDHFLVLNSESPEVVSNSIRILENHALIFKMLGITSKVIVHVGSHLPNKEIALERFKKVFLSLPKYLQNIIVLENDDKTYTVTETLNLANELSIPMVLDFHHFNCNHEKGEDINILIPLIIKTWDKELLPPKMHFSSPKSKKEKRTHHFYIDYNSFLKFINILKFFNQDLDIMLESKGKDEALFKLLRQLKFYKQVKMQGNSIIFD